MHILVAAGRRGAASLSVSTADCQLFQAALWKDRTISAFGFRRDVNQHVWPQVQSLDGHLQDQIVHVFWKLLIGALIQNVRQACSHRQLSDKNHSRCSKQLAEKELDAILEKLCFCPNPSLHFCSRKSDKLALVGSSHGNRRIRPFQAIPVSASNGANR
jgi:hypothetical protein